MIPVKKNKVFNSIREYNEYQESRQPPQPPKNKQGIGRVKRKGVKGTLGRGNKEISYCFWRWRKPKDFVGSFNSACGYLYGTLSEHCPHCGKKVIERK